MLQVPGLLGLDEPVLLAAVHVDQVQLVFFLSPFHQSQVQIVFRVGLSLHFDCVVAQQVFDCLHAFIDRFFDLVARHLCKLVAEETLLLLTEPCLAFISLYVSYESRHEFIHRDRDVVGVLLGIHFVSKIS